MLECRPCCHTERPGLLTSSHPAGGAWHWCRQNEMPRSGPVPLGKAVDAMKIFSFLKEKPWLLLPVTVDNFGKESIKSHLTVEGTFIWGGLEPWLSLRAATLPLPKPSDRGQVPDHHHAQGSSLVTWDNIRAASRACRESESITQVKHL